MLEAALKQKLSDIMLKRQELQDQERKHEEDLQLVDEGIEAVENVNRTLREGGSKMTINEITDMRNRF